MKRVLVVLTGIAALALACGEGDTEEATDKITIGSDDATVTIGAGEDGAKVTVEQDGKKIDISADRRVSQV